MLSSKQNRQKSPLLFKIVQLKTTGLSRLSPKPFLSTVLLRQVAKRYVKAAIRKAFQVENDQRLLWRCNSGMSAGKLRGYSEPEVVMAGVCECGSDMNISNMEASNIPHCYSDLLSCVQSVVCTCSFSWMIFACVHTEVPSCSSSYCMCLLLWNRCKRFVQKVRRTYELPINTWKVPIIFSHQENVNENQRARDYFTHPRMTEMKKAHDTRDIEPRAWKIADESLTLPCHCKKVAQQCLNAIKGPDRSVWTALLVVAVYWQRQKCLLGQLLLLFSAAVLTK